MRLLLVLVLLLGCSAPSPATKAATPEAVVASLQAAGLPISGVTVFTAETDPNKLLGRPNHYVAKANWIDSRVEGTTGTVEIFANEADRKARQDYVASVTKGIGPLAEYAYAKGTILVRVPGKLTPDQAADYERTVQTLP